MENDKINMTELQFKELVIIKAKLEITVMRAKDIDLFKCEIAEITERLDDFIDECGYIPMLKEKRDV